VVIGCCLLREQSSLKAFWYLATSWKRVREKRREIMQRRRVNDAYMATWFQYTPVSKPLPIAAAPVAPRHKRPVVPKPNSSSIKLAILGTRGIPARYGASRPSRRNSARIWPRAATR